MVQLRNGTKQNPSSGLGSFKIIHKFASSAVIARTICKKKVNFKREQTATVDARQRRRVDRRSGGPARFCGWLLSCRATQALSVGRRARETLSCCGIGDARSPTQGRGCKDGRGLRFLALH